MCNILHIKHICALSESETTSASNWKVIRDGEAGRRKARWEKVTFTLEFSALKGLKILATKILFILGNVRLSRRAKNFDIYNCRIRGVTL